MSSAARDHYMREFAIAESRGMCLIPDSASSRRQLKRMCTKGLAVQPFRGLFARCAYWESLSRSSKHLHILRALSKLHPDWVFSHYSAALVHGLSVSYRDLQTVHRLVSSASHLNSANQMTYHYTESPYGEVVYGVRVTTFEQTAADCACSGDFKKSLAVADSYVRLAGASKDDYERLLECYCHPHRRGIVAAREAARWVDGRAENGGESMARAAIIELGYAPPDLQVEMDDPIEGRMGYRVDFLWTHADGTKIIGEFDGREKYIDPVMTEGRRTVDVLADERLRESRISASGTPVMRLSFKDIMNPRILIRILEAYGIPYLVRCGERFLVVSRGKCGTFRGIRYTSTVYSPLAA